MKTVIVTGGGENEWFSRLSFPESSYRTATLDGDIERLSIRVAGTTQGHVLASYFGLEESFSGTLLIRAIPEVLEHMDAWLTVQNLSFLCGICSPQSWLLKAMTVGAINGSGSADKQVSAGMDYLKLCYKARARHPDMVALYDEEMIVKPDAGAVSSVQRYLGPDVRISRPAPQEEDRSTVLQSLMTDLILQSENKWFELYDELKAGSLGYSDFQPTFPPTRDKLLKALSRAIDVNAPRQDLVKEKQCEIDSLHVELENCLAHIQELQDVVETYFITDKRRSAAENRARDRLADSPGHLLLQRLHTSE